MHAASIALLQLSISSWLIRPYSLWVDAIITVQGGLRTGPVTSVRTLAALHAHQRSPYVGLADWAEQRRQLGI